MCGLSASAHAQFNWPEDKAAAQSHYVQFQDAVNASQFETARPHFVWLYKQAPDLNKALYVKGTKIYEGLQEKATDPKVKTALQDTALMLYDARIQYFQEEADVLNRKGVLAFAYLSGRPDFAQRQQDIFKMYQKIFALNGTDVYLQNVTPYMYLACLEKTAGRLTDEEVLKIYDQVLTVYEVGVKDPQLAVYWEQIKEDADKRLASCVTIDCDFVREQLAPKLKENPTDMTLAKKIESLLLQGGCSDDPLFLETAKLIEKTEPAYGWAITIARKEMGARNYDEAFKYYDEAAGLAENNGKKADVYLEIAQQRSRLGQKQSARAAAQQALSLDGSKRDAYELIGDLYFNSYQDCQGENPVENRLAFIAAYEKYQKAGNANKMANAKEQFPSREELFQYNLQPGQSKSLGCWIGETVTLQTRPQ